MLFQLFISLLLCSNQSSCGSIHAEIDFDNDEPTSSQISSSEDFPFPTFHDVTTESNFYEELSAIMQDYENKFVNIKSVINQDESSGTRTRYYTNIHLERTVESYIEEDAATGRVEFKASYSGTTYAEQAIDVYESLKANIILKDVEGKFEEEKETINGNIRSQRYTTYAVKANSVPVQLDMIVDIAIIEGPSTWGYGVESKVWVTTVRIYGRE